MFYTYPRKYPMHIKCFLIIQGLKASLSHYAFCVQSLHLGWSIQSFCVWLFLYCEPEFHHIALADLECLCRQVVFKLLKIHMPLPRECWLKDVGQTPGYICFLMGFSAFHSQSVNCHFSVVRRPPPCLPALVPVYCGLGQDHTHV